MSVLLHCNVGTRGRYADLAAYIVPLNSGLFMTTCIFLSCARFSSKTKILLEVFQHDGPYYWCLFRESYSCKQFKTFCIFEVYYVDVVVFYNIAVSV